MKTSHENLLNEYAKNISGTSLNILESMLLGGKWNFSLGEKKLILSACCSEVRATSSVSVYDSLQSKWS